VCDSDGWRCACSQCFMPRLATLGCVCSVACAARWCCVGLCLFFFYPARLEYHALYLYSRLFP
jgi:hypothetical protein